MKIAFASKNQMLKQAIQGKKSIQLIDVIDIDEATNIRRLDGIIFDRGNLKTIDLVELRDKFPNVEMIVLLEVGSDQAFEKASITNNVQIIDHKIDSDSFFHFIQKNWLEVEGKAEKNNVVAFLGTHYQVGVTQTVFSFAKIMKEFNYNVCVLGFNPYNPGIVPTLEGKPTFDQLYTLLDNKSINDFKSLGHYISRLETFDYLIGNNDFYKAPSFEKEPIELLISIIKEEYDYVLVDCGAHYDNYLPITALGYADTHILVASQEYDSYRQYQNWEQKFLSKFNFNPKEQYLLINKYDPASIITAKFLQNSIGYEFFGTLPVVPSAADEVFEYSILANTSYKSYTRQLVKNVKAFINEKPISKNKTNPILALLR